MYTDNSRSKNNCVSPDSCNGRWQESNKDKIGDCIEVNEESCEEVSPFLPAPHLKVEPPPPPPVEEDVTGF
jgi:hypothetical protein